MTRYSVVPLATLLLLVGINSACKIIGPEQRSEVEVMFQFSEPVASDLNFSARISGIGRVVVFERRDFSGGPTGPFRSDTVETDSAGTADLECSVTKGGVQSSGSLQIAFPTDWRIDLICAVGESNPYDECIGCFGSESFPLDPGLGFASVDSLYMIWGGNSISDPVDY